MKKTIVTLTSLLVGVHAQAEPSNFEKLEQSLAQSYLNEINDTNQQMNPTLLAILRNNKVLKEIRKFVDGKEFTEIDFAKMIALLHSKYSESELSFPEIIEKEMKLPTTSVDIEELMNDLVFADRLKDTFMTRDGLMEDGYIEIKDFIETNNLDQTYLENYHYLNSVLGQEFSAKDTF